jgi:hypothetical protein
MGRLVTVKKVEAERQKAIQYVKTSILYPSVFIGLVSLILGYGALIYLLFKGKYFANLVADSLVLLGIGILLGWAQARYHHFLLERYPEYYAERRRRAEQIRTGRLRKIEIAPKPAHRGRWLIPYLYLAASIGLLALVIYYTPRLNAYSAIFLPLAGLYNARFFFWKRKLHL